MSFFQWENVSVGAGNVEYREITGIERLNLTATVKGYKYPIPIHYHCKEDSVNDVGKSFDESYPDELDERGASAFRIGDVARIMYRFPNNESPMIVGFKGEDKKCGPHCLLIVAEQAQSTTERTPFLCILWDPENNKVPDNLGIEFPVSVNDSELKSEMGEFPVASIFEESEIGEFPVTSISEESEIQEPTKLYEMVENSAEFSLPLEEPYWNCPANFAYSLDCGFKTDQERYAACMEHYLKENLKITSNDQAVMQEDFYEIDGPSKTEWNSWIFKKSGSIRKFPFSFYSKGKVDLGVDKIIAQKKAFTEDSESDLAIPELLKENSLYEELDEYRRIIFFQWKQLISENSGGDYSSDFERSNILYTTKMPFNSVFIRNGHDFIYEPLTVFGESPNEGIPPATLGGKILKIAVGNYKEETTLIRGSGNHGIYRTDGFRMLPTSILKWHHERKEKVGHGEFGSQWGEGINDIHEYAIHLPIGVTWTIPSIDNLFYFLSRTVQNENLTPIGPLASLGCLTDSVTYKDYQGYSYYSWIHSMIDVTWKNLSFPLNYAYAKDPCMIALAKKYYDIHTPTISNMVSHPTWDAGIIEEEGIMFQIYAFFPPLMTRDIYKNGLDEDQEKERKKKQEEYEDWPVDSGPSVQENSDIEGVSHPYNYVWAACDYYVGEDENWETKDPRMQKENEKLTNAIKEFILKIRIHEDYDPEKLIFLKVYRTQVATETISKGENT